jgi:hypothetical protein
MTILDKIIEHKRRELALLSSAVSVKDFETRIDFEHETISMSEFLRDKNKTGIQ